MKRSSFIKSLGVLAGAAFIPEVKNTNVERMRITSSGNVGMGVLDPKQLLEITRRVNGGIRSLEYRIK
jgi:hypothetical protein